MKIKSIEVLNYKAISEASIDLNGCSAIITGGNNKGKTSLLRGLIDRMRGERPEFIVKQGEEKGQNIIELTDGSRFEWKFTDKSEQITYITSDGLKVNSGVLKQLGEKYFGIKFDIDKFISQSSKEQVNTLSKILGVDLTKLNQRYTEAYQERTIVNRELKNLEARNLIQPVEVKKPDIEALKIKKSELKKQLELKNEEISKENQKLKFDYLADLSRLTEENKKFNALQDQKRDLLKAGNYFIENLTHMSKDKVFGKCVDLDKALKILGEFEKPEEYKPVPAVLDEPLYKFTITDPQIDLIDEEIEKAQMQETQYQLYKNSKIVFDQWMSDLEKKRKLAFDKDKAVKDIENEKKQLIANANLPNEFSFTEDGIYYNGLPLTNNQLSSSSKYIAALKLNSLILGTVKTMHFDASFLDNNSLKEIQDWAEENDLQLLIERPDYDGDDIAYRITQ